MPISSHQISGMIGGQQAMFGNFASYAQQISPGGGQGPMPTYSNPMAGVGAGPATPFEDTGEFGAKALSAIGNVGLPALGTAAMIGGSFLPGAMGRAIGGLDPMSAGLSGFARGAGLRAGGQGIMANLGRIAQGGIGGIARAGIGGLAGGLMAAAPAMAIGGAVQYGVGQMVQGAQFENQVGGFLQNQFRFANQGSETGYGFGREQRGQISGMLREMGHSEMMSSPGEMLNLMKAGTGMGVFRAVQDARQFKEKFKEMVGALKEVATTMNTTLEGAVPFFSQARQQGFWTPQDIMRNAQMARQTASATGMSVAQTQQMMGQGAQMARSVGALGATGAEGMAKSMGLVGGALRGGVVSEQQLSEATGGLQGPEAIQALSGTMQAATTRFAAGTTGRWLMAAMGRDGFKGLDIGKLKAFTRGDLSIGQIGGMARGNIAKQGAFNFVQNEEELRGELIKQGPEAQLGLIRGLVGGSLYGESSRDKYITRRMMKRYFGVSGRQADTLAEMARNAPQIMEDNERRSSAEADNMARDRDQMMSSSWEGVKKKAAKWWDSTVKEPLQKMGADISRRIATWWEHTSDKLWGTTPARHRLRGITEEGLGALQAGAMGDKREMELIFGRAGQMEKRLGAGGSGLGLAQTATSGGVFGAFKGQGGLLGGLRNDFATGMGWGGERTTDQIETLRRMGVGEYAFKTEEERDRRSKEWGLVGGAYRGGPGAGGFRAMSKADIDRAVEGVRAAQSGVVGVRGAAALGFESEKSAKSLIEGAQRDMGSTQWKLAAQRLAHQTGKSGRALAEALVQEVEAGRIGGDNVRKMLAGSKDMMTKVHRLAAAQTPEMRKAFGGVSLEGEVEKLGMTDLLGSEKQAAELGKRIEGHEKDLAEAMMPPRETSWIKRQMDPTKGVMHDVQKANLQHAVANLSSGEHGSQFRRAMMLMRMGRQDEASTILSNIGADKGLSAAERTLLTNLSDPNHPNRKQIMGVVGALGIDYQDKNRLSFQETIARRRQRMGLDSHKLSEKITSTLDSVKGTGGASLGAAIKGLMGATDVEDYQTKLRKLMDVAAGTDDTAAQAAAQLLRDTPGAEDIGAAIAGAKTAKRDVEMLTKKGGHKTSGLQAEALGRQLGTKVTTEDIKALQTGEWEKTRDKIAGRFQDPVSKKNAQQIIDAMKKGDKTALDVAIKDRQTARNLQFLSDKKGILAAEVRKKQGDEGSTLQAGVGSPKGMHIEMTRQTDLLKQLIKAVQKSKGGSDPSKPSLGDDEG